MKYVWIVCGVGVLLVQAACGAVIYSGPQNIVVSGLYPDVAIDLDEVMPSEFVFEYTRSSGKTELNITGLAGGGSFFACERLGPFHGPPVRMDAGETVGAELLWLSMKDEGLLAGFYETWWGGRFIGQAGYIGVKFELVDGWHFGWIGFEAKGDASEGLITGWAFEDVPDQTIKAGEVPEPTTLAMLVVGWIFLHRRRLC